MEVADKLRCERQSNRGTIGRPARVTTLLLGLAWLVGCTTNNAPADDSAPGEMTPPACDTSSDALPPGAYDFIVVGSGAGGGPLASRLARAGCQVLLLEAGQDVGGRPEYQVPAMHALSTEHEDMAWWYFVQHHADASIDAEDSKWTERGILYPRGTALGGSTAVNALVTVLPSRSDWNRMATLTGDPGWRADAMDPYYDRVREWLSIEVPDPNLATGDETIVRYLMAAASAFAGEDPLGASLDPLDAANTATELSRLLTQDVNDALRQGETTGLYRLPLATNNGRRNGTREFIVETVEQGYPLTVKTGAFVTRVLWDDKVATPTAAGVEFVEAPAVYAASLEPAPPAGETHQALAAREVVLSAGTFNSPQLLMLSGVGDPQQLSAHGIAPVVDLRGVGENMQDRYEAAVVTELSDPLATVEACTLGDADAPSDPCLEDWEQGQGVYQTTGLLASVLRRSSDEAALADLQVFAAPGDARGYYPGYSRDVLVDKQRFTWLVLKAHTQNQDGYVRLASADPFATPIINFNYFDEADPMADPDLRAVVEGVKFVREIEAELRGSLVDGDVVELWPGPELRSDEDLARWIDRETWGHHASCSNKMGKPEDPMAVVDSRFRVIGAEHLRVVDASVFPEIPGTFIALPTFMLSERAADIILEDQR